MTFSLGVLCFLLAFALFAAEGIVHRSPIAIGLAALALGLLLA